MGKSDEGETPSLWLPPSSSSSTSWSSSSPSSSTSPQLSLLPLVIRKRPLSFLSFIFRAALGPQLDLYLSLAKNNHHHQYEMMAHNFNLHWSHFFLSLTKANWICCQFSWSATIKEGCSGNSEWLVVQKLYPLSPEEDEDYSDGVWEQRDEVTCRELLGLAGYDDSLPELHQPVNNHRHRRHHHCHYRHCHYFHWHHHLWSYTNL